MGVLGDELTSWGMGVLLLRASGCFLSEHFTVGVVVIGVSVVSRTSPNFTLFSKTGIGLNIFLNRDAIRRIAFLSSAAITAVPLIEIFSLCVSQRRPTFGDSSVMKYTVLCKQTECVRIKWRPVVRFDDLKIHKRCQYFVRSVFVDTERTISTSGILNIHLP